MNILCVIDSLGPGGAQRQLVNLAIGFKGNGHKVSFLVYHHHDFYLEYLTQNEIQVHEIIEPGYLKRLLKMRQYIRGGKFNSVLSFLDAPNFICEIAGLPWRKWRLVVGERSANPNILKSAKLSAYRWIHLLADYVVTNSYANQKIIKKINPLISAKKCKVIYNSIDFEKWKPSPDYLYRKDGKFRIIVAASHQYLKNLNSLIDAVIKLDKEEKSKLQINWYGSDGHDFSKVEAIKKIESNNLKEIFCFHEPVSNFHEIILSADAIGLFSFYEGLPNVVCEGMAVGKPIIATNISDIPMLISNERLLSNPSDSDSISRSLSYLLSISQEDLILEGIKNRERATLLFKKENIISQYLALTSE